MELCRADLRCLDTHSHLGNFVFDHHPQYGIRHYEVGLRIGGLSLGEDFSGVLPCGVLSTTGRFCAACTVTDCASGVSDALTRRSLYFARCFG